MTDEDVQLVFMPCSTLYVFYQSGVLFLYVSFHLDFRFPALVDLTNGEASVTYYFSSCEDDGQAEG